jgi:hypothetical protein
LVNASKIRSTGALIVISWTIVSLASVGFIDSPQHNF